jgi:hypothetical protein
MLHLLPVTILICMMIWNEYKLNHTTRYMNELNRGIENGLITIFKARGEKLILKDYFDTFNHDGT